MLELVCSFVRFLNLFSHSIAITLYRGHGLHLAVFALEVAQRSFHILFNLLGKGPVRVCKGDNGTDDRRPWCREDAMASQRKRTVCSGSDVLTQARLGRRLQAYGLACRVPKHIALPVFCAPVRRVSLLYYHFARISTYL